MRQFFKTIKVHHCYNFEACEPKPKTCKCRKFIAKSFAEDLVADGVADWVISYPIGTTIYDAIILKGIAGKTPRAQTIEKAHIERYIGISGDPDNPEDQSQIKRYKTEQEKKEFWE